MKMMIKTVGLVVWALSATSFLLAAGDAGVSNEVWIAIRTDGQIGTGTLANPYDGSGGNFDAWMREWAWGQQGPDTNNIIRSNLTIHLLPGTYKTGVIFGTNSYSTPLPYGTKLAGSSTANTVLQLANFNQVIDAAVLGGGYTNNSLGQIYIADLTLDCNWGGANVVANKISGINLFCDRGTVERVKVINFGAAGNTNATSQEVFPLSWTSPNNGGSFTIQNCSVEGPVKGGTYAYATCIGAFGQVVPPSGSSARLLNNRVVNVTNGIAYAIGELNGVLEGNFASSCGSGFNLDSWQNANCIIRGNQFRDVAFGLNIGNYFKLNGTFVRYVIENNFIEVNDRYASGSSGNVPIGMQFNGNTTNFVVRGNIIVPIPQYVGTFQTNGYWYGFAFHGGNSQGQGDGENTKYVMENNLVDAAFTNSLWTGFFPPYTDGSYFFNNHDFIGRSLKGFPPDNARRNQVNFIGVSGTSYVLANDPSAAQLEGYVELETTNSTTKTITLPYAAWEGGRKFDLAFYNTTSGSPTACSVILVAQTGEPIYDTVSQSFASSFTYQINSSGYLTLELFSAGSAGHWVVRH